jgi:phosphatidylglycerophosphate synthase
MPAQVCRPQVPEIESMKDPAGLQILLSVPPQPPLVAGVPGVLRTAHDLGADSEVRGILLCTQSHAFFESWRGRLASLPWKEVASYNDSSPLGEQLDADSAVLVLAPDGMPDAASLRSFLRQSREGRGPTAWAWNGTVVAAYYPDANRLLERLPPGSREFPQEALAYPDARRLPAPQGSWESLGDADGVRRAEDRLFRSLRKDTDGYLARLDRTLSIALSRLLIRTPVTPNGITAVSLIVGLLGAALLASADYWIALLGAALLWSGCVLDGSDGEVARLKLLTSRFGARFDIIADNVVHLAIFVAIPIRVRRLHPGFDVWAPAAALIAGVLLSTFSVWWLILRQPEERRAAPQRVYERIASRDFIYLVFFLTAIGRLEWFLWSAAVGANLFWLSLWWVSRRTCPG